MTVTPHDIQNKEFREKFRGYNQDDVDTFLDEVAEEFGRLYQDNQRLRIHLATLQQEAAQRGTASAPTMPSPAAVVPAAPAGARAPDRAEAREEMKRALVATQRAAEAALEEAKRRAAEIIARAEQRAKEIDDLTARRAKDVDADAGNALSYAQQRVEELRRQEQEIRSRLRRMLAEHVKVLQQLETEPVAQQPAAPRPDRDGPQAPAASEERRAAVAQPEPAPADPPPSPQSPTAHAQASTGRERKPLWLGGQDQNGASSRPGAGIVEAVRQDQRDARRESEGADRAARAAVVDRMARELGEAAAPPDPTSMSAVERTRLLPRDTFWKR